MTSNSDSDLQAYINQLSRKAHDFRHEADSSSGSISTPTHISSFEIEERRDVQEKSGARIPKSQDAKSSKIKLLEEKYLKTAIEKETKKGMSVSWSREDAASSMGELEPHPAVRGEFGYDDPSYNLSSRYSEETGINLKKNVVTVNEMYGASREEKRAIERVSDEGRSNSSEMEPPPLEREKSLFFASTRPAPIRRKSSTGSLLMSKDGVFYSSSISTDAKPKSGPQKKLTSSVIKFAKYDMNAENSARSVSVPTHATESIEEEVHSPEVRSNAEREGPLQGNRQRSSSSISSITGAPQGRERKTKKDPLTPEEIPPSRRPEKSSAGRKPTKSVDRKRKDDALSSREDEENKVRPRTTNKKPSKENEKRAKRTARETPNDWTHSSTSVTSSSASLSSSSSCSFSVKMKRKKYIKRKRRLKKEKELTELIIKALIKNLPFLMRHSVFQHPRVNVEDLGRTTRYDYLCDICGGDATSSRVTNSRVDDALRQTINLTRQFLEAHEKFLLTHAQLFPPFKYTSLKKS